MMDDLQTANPAQRAARDRIPSPWPADLYLLIWLVLLAFLLLIAPGEIPDRGNMMFETALLILMSLIFVVGVDRTSGPLWTFFRMVYFLFPILYSFRVLHFLIPALRNIDGRTEQFLIRADVWIFGGHVAKYFEPIRTPLLTELMYYFYVTYYIIPLIVVIVIFYKWKRNRLEYTVLQETAAGLTLGFLTSYFLYIIVPARGPWYGISNEVFSSPLRSIWIGEQIRQAIFRFEMEMYDAFPSGHTEIYLIAVLYAWKYTRKLFWLVVFLFAGMVLSTMYVRFHYGVDVLAGGLLGVAVVWSQAYLHGTWSSTEEQDQQTERDDLNDD